jgi:hypothetical protein
MPQLFLCLYFCDYQNSFFLVTSWRAFNLSVKPKISNSTDNHKFQNVDGVQVCTSVLIEWMTISFTIGKVCRCQIPVMTTNFTLSMVYNYIPLCVLFSG